MNRTLGRGAALVAAIATTLVLCVTGTANAWWNHGGCNYGEAVGKGATPLNTFDFNVCQKSKNIKDVYGEFEAAGNFGSGAVIHPRGPVTCADIKGNVASFFYPFDDKSFPPANPAVPGLLVVAIDGGKTGDKIGFAPLTAANASDCSQTSAPAMAAKATAAPVTSGFITVTDKSVKIEQPKSGAPAVPPFVGPGN